MSRSRAARFTIVAGALALVTAPARADRDPWQPGATAASFARPGGRVRVHYVTTTGDAVPADDADGSGVPDFVEEVAARGDEVVSRLGALGFRAPVTDGALGGDDRLDIYLRDLAGADGSFTADTCTDVPTRCAGHLTIENDFAGYSYPSRSIAIRVLTSHELFHAVQAAYDADQPAAWSEGSAVWAEELLYPEQDDFERLVAAFLARTFRPFERPGGGFGDLYPYGAGLWPYFLAQRHGAEIVRGAWERCEDTGDDPGFLDAIAAELSARGDDLEPAWIEFTRWNARTGARGAGGDYPDAGRLAMAVRDAPLATPGVATVAVEGLSARYLPLAGIAGATRLEVRATAPVAAALLAHDRATEVVRLAGSDGVDLLHRFELRGGAGADVELVVSGATRGTPVHEVTVEVRPDLGPDEPAPPDDGGCAAAPGGAGLVPVALVVLALVARRRRRPAAVALAIAATAGLAHAQPAPAADGVEDLDGDGDIDDDDRSILAASETIEIEDASDATRMAESARAVTVVDLARDRERAADLGEVLSRAHGIQVRRTGGLGSSTRLSLNGLVDDQIRFFVDGVPLEYAGWGLGIANVPVDLVQRVDVYRGVVPIGLGADALGGAIDLVTDPSWVDRASVSYQVGSFGTHRVSAGARARDDASGLAVGLSLFGDRAANDYPIDVEVADERGRLTPATVRRFHDAYTAGGTIVEAGVVGKGAIERALIRAFATQYSKELQHNTVMTIPYGDASYAGDSRGVAADVAIATGAWHGRLIAGVARTATDFRDIGLTVYDWYGRAVRDRRIAGEIGLDPIQQRITETGLYARANLERRFGDHHTLRVALAPTSHHRDGRDFLDPNPGGRDPISARRDLVQVVSGVELEQTARGDRLENIAFAKHYLHASDAEDARPGFVFVPIADTISRFGAGDSLRYRVSDAVAVKASYEWATRMPSVDELFGDGILVQPNLELAPETSHNANLGVHLERETRHGAWGGEVGGFARLADQLIVLIGNDRLFSYQNVYAVRILGIEGSAAWVAPGEWASIEANLTVQDIRNSSSEGTFGDFEGDRIPNRPWLLGSVAASVRRRGVVRAGDELSLFGTSRYVHEFFRGWESQGVREFKQVVPSQLVHGAGVTYAARGRMPVITTVEVQNLSDARVYDSFGVQRPGRALFVKLSGEL